MLSNEFLLIHIHHDLPWPARITPSPSIINPFLNKLAANVTNSIGINPPLFILFSLMCFISNPDSSSDLTIFIIFSISSFEIINAVVHDP